MNSGAALQTRAVRPPVDSARRLMRARALSAWAGNIVVTRSGLTATWM